MNCTPEAGNAINRIHYVNVTRFDVFLVLDREFIRGVLGADFANQTLGAQADAT